MARIALITPDYFKRQDERLCFEAKGHKLIIAKDRADDRDASGSIGIDAVISDPPDLMIVQKGLHRHLDQEIIQALKNNLQLALMPVILLVTDRDLAVGVDMERYPVDDLISEHAPIEEVITRVELALARAHRVADNNPLTKLPGNSSILKTIQQALDAKRDCAVAYVDIDNFKPFNDRYGFSRGDEVIRMVSRILVNVIQETAGKESFVGHVGGDDFVFLIPLDRVEETCNSVIQNFNALIPLFLDEEDLTRGYFLSKDRQGKEQRFPLTSLSIAVVPCPRGRFLHYGEVAQVAAQVKKKVKEMEGSNYFIDRRRS